MFRSLPCILLCALLAGITLSPSAQAQPVEKQLIDEFVKIQYTDGYTRRNISNEFIETFIKARQVALIRLLGEVGLTDPHITPSMRQELSTKLDSLIRSALLTKLYQPNQESEAWEAFRRLSTDLYLHHMIAAWMGMSPPESSGKPTEATMVSATARPNRLHISSVQIKQEVGGYGEGNRVADPGEWVQFEVELTNASSLPWFSTSVFLAPGTSQCIWVDPGKDLKGEREVGEFHTPGDSRTFSFWAYVYATCPSGTTPTIGVTIADTHRTSKTGDNATIRLKQINRGLPLVENILVDGDIPGESNGNNQKEISPDIKVELSHGVRFTGTPNVLLAENSQQIASDQVPVFSNVPVTPSSPLISVNKQTFRAGDDLDLTTKPELAYKEGQRRYTASRKFFPRGEEWGRLWVGTDISATLAVQQNQAKVPVATPKKQKPIERDEAVRMVIRHLTFKSRPVPPQDKNAIGAVAGHDVLLNEKGLQKEWEARTEDSSPPTPSPLYAAHYTYRRYYSVDMKYVSSRVRPKPVPQPRQPTLPAPEPIKEQSYSFRLDLAGSGEFWSKNKAAHDLTLGGFSTDMYFGSSWTFMLHAHTGSGTADEITGDVTGLALGVGYVFSLANNHFEIHPHLGFGLESRTLKGEVPDNLYSGESTIEREETAPLFDLGLTLRLMPSSAFGFHLGFDILAVGVTNSYTGEYFTGSSQQLSGGVTLRF